MTIDVSLEPFSVIIGFKEVKDLTNFWTHLSEFLTKKNDPYEDPIKTLEEEKPLLIDQISNSDFIRGLS